MVEIMLLTTNVVPLHCNNCVNMMQFLTVIFMSLQYGWHHSR